jgi:hypothetical protein
MMPRVVHRLVAISIVLVAPIAGTVTIALAGPGSSTVPITKTEAIAFARAVNLVASDVPGAKKVELPPHEAAIDEGEADTSMSKAVRCARPRLVADRPVHSESSLLIDARTAVASEVRVMPTEAVAATELAAFASRHGHICFARATKVEVTSENEPHEGSNPIKATFIPLVKLLGPGAIGVHTLSSLSYPAMHHHPRTSAIIHTDAALFRVGPAEIMFITVGRATFPAATEGRLLSLLYSRAQAHKL